METDEKAPEETVKELRKRVDVEQNLEKLLEFSQQTKVVDRGPTVPDET